MKIYMAGASKEVDQCAAAIAALREMGYEVDLDWTKSVIEYRAKGVSDVHLSEDERIKFAQEDIDAAVDADIFWLRTPQNASLGAWVELGAAIHAAQCGDRSRTIVVSGDHRRSIFTSLANVFCDTHEDALEYLRSRAQRGAGGT
jgi:hypothetical protein